MVLGLSLLMLLVGCIPRPLPEPPPRSAMVHVIGTSPGKEKSQLGAWEGTMESMAEIVKVYLVKNNWVAIVAMTVSDIGMFNFSFLTDLARNVADSEIEIIRGVLPLEEGQIAKITIVVAPDGTKTVTMEPVDE